MFKQFKETWKIQLLILVLILLSHVPLPYLMMPVKPNLIIVIIFFFSIIKETRVPITALLVLGLVEDFLSHDLIGISSLIYIVTSIIGASNRKALSKQKFVIVLAAFMVTAFLIKFIELATSSLYFNHNYFCLFSLFDVIATILLYPVLHLFFTQKLDYFRG